MIRFFKRQFGSREPIFFDERGQAWLPEAIAALLLRKLVFDAESASPERVERAVITVPAHFNDPQRKAVLNAAALAKLPVLGLVEEPVAAALHYGVQIAIIDEIVLVYDFGGGTFDATALSMDASGVYVLAKTGLTELGGKEIDEKIGEMVLAQFARALARPSATGARTLLELRRVSEELKIELCLPGRKSVRRLVLLGGQAVEVEITASRFEAAIRDLVEQTRGRDAALRRRGRPAAGRRAATCCSWAAPRSCRWWRRGCGSCSADRGRASSTTSPAGRWPTAPRCTRPSSAATPRPSRFRPSCAA